jgi:hypothetical protein
MSTGINGVGNALTGQSGTGAFTGNVSPTITTPKIVTQIQDVNGNPIIGLGAAASAVNYISTTNAATNQSVQVNFTGSDTDVYSVFANKGAGSFSFKTTNTSGVTYFTGTALQHTSSFIFANTANNNNFTFPDVSGTVGLIIADTTWSPVLTGSGGGSATYALQSGSYTQIGTRVLFDLAIVITGSTLSGNITITGLPITNGAYYVALSITATSLGATSTPSLMADIVPSSSVINLFTFVAGSTTALTATNLDTSAVILISGQYHI